MGIMESLIIHEKVIQYIGSTKLSCDDCYATIKLNDELFSNPEREVCGRHGKNYSDRWLTPVFMKGRENEIKK